MRDRDKTKEQLIDELVKSRRRIAELGASELKYRQEKKELIEAIERLKSFFEYAPDACYLSDLKGNFVDGNRAAEEIVGCKREELIGKSFLKLSLLSTKQIAKAAALLAKNALGQPTGPDEFTLNRKGGSQVVVEISTFPVKIGDRSLVLGIARDVTERKEWEEELKRHRAHLEELVEERTLDLTSANAELQQEVAERRRVEEALRESEGKNRALLEAIPDLIFRLSKDGIFLDFIPAKSIDLFASPDDFLGKRIDEVFPAEEAQQAMSYMEQALQAGDTQTFEYQLPDLLSDDIRDYETRYVPCGKDEILAIVRDITQRKRAEGTLRRLEQEENAILDSMSEFVLCLGTEMRVLWANKATSKMLALAPEQFVGRYCYELWHRRSEPCVGCPVKKALETGEPQIGEMTGANGGVSFIRGYPLRDEDNDVMGIVEVVLDITKRKRAEEALAAEKERLAVTLRSIGDGVIATDTKGKVVSINKVAETLTGWTEEEAVGKPLEQVFHIVNEHSRKRCRDPVGKVMESGGMVDLADDLTSDVVLINRDGKERIIADSGGPIRDKDSKIIGVILVFRDITEEREIEAELVKVQKLESIGVLAGGIAHDFNNILTGILGNISLARLYTDPQKISKRLEEAEKATMRARDLTQRLLTFSRGGAPIRKTASIADLLRDSATFAASGSNVRCEFSIADDLWLVEIDEGQMNQVISNLIVNAEQAMPEGGVVEIRAENMAVGAEDVIPVKAGVFIKISIKDHGVGIAKEHIQKIFDPYFTTKQKGSGLGLATAFSIVRNHDGYITVESQVGMGATFHIYLPASQKRTLTKGKKEKEKIIAGKGRILVMDDEELVRELASNILTDIGYEVTIASDGAEAIELYKTAEESEHPFDVVILDLTVPGGMGGEVAVQKLKEIDPEAKVIASSGYSNDPVIADFRDYGFSGAIAKPYRIKKLSNLLHEVMMDAEG